MSLFKFTYGKHTSVFLEQIATLYVEINIKQD